MEINSLRENQFSGQEPLGLEMQARYQYISVVIPTYNRADILRKQIDAFALQNWPSDQYEVVVVDDGSKDCTNKMMQELSGRTPAIRYIRQTNKGPAAARNTGIRASKGEIILILNDDSIPDKWLLSEHCRSHNIYQEPFYGVLGFCTWSRDNPISPFMKWLENGGPCFDYSAIKGEWAHWYQTWTCNVSFKKAFLVDCGLFDESFPSAAWEDIELGYRMNLLGYKLCYNSKAFVWHDHVTSIRSIKNKMKANGASAVILGNKITDKSMLPPLARPFLSLFLRTMDSIFLNRLLIAQMERVAMKNECIRSMPLLYNVLLLHYRIEGQKEYLRKHAQEANKRS